MGTLTTRAIQSPFSETQQASYTGKITEVIFDCHGRMKGFVLSECCDGGLSFKACDIGLERIVLQACTGRFLVTVRTTADDPLAVYQLIVKG